MADINLGSISYGVSVDDKGAVDGLSKLGVSVDKAVAELNTLTPASTKASSSLGQAGNAASKAAPKMSKLAQVSQNAGYQIQDFTVQIAGGQSAILAMSQQLPQLLGSFGALGAGLGAVTAIIGGLFLAFGNTTSSIEKFEKAVESAKAVLTIGASGVAEYSDEMKKLNAISKDLAQIKIAATLSELERQTKEGAKALQDLTQDATNVVNMFRSFNDVVENISGKKAGADGFNAAADAIKGFNFAVGAFVAQQTPENVRDLESALNALVATGATTTKTGNDLVSAAVDLVAKFKEGKLTADEFKKALAGTSIEAGKSREEITSLVKAIELQAATVGKTERETALYVATLKGANDQEKEAINLAFDKIEAEAAKQEASKKSAAALKEYEAAQEKTIAQTAGILESLDSERKQLTMTADGYEEYALRKRLAASGASEAVISAATRELAALQALRAETALMAQIDEEDSTRKQTVTSEVETIAKEGQDPLTKLTAERDRQLALIAEYETLETANHQVAVDARAAIDRQYESERMLAAEQSFAMQSEGNQMLIDGLNSLSGTVSQVFTGMLTQTMTAQDAVRGLANAILNDAINSLVQMGLQYVKNAILKNTADKAMLASEQATKAASAAAHTVAVGATVAELTALGAMGAFAATAAIPIVGPGLAPAAAATAAGTIAAIGSTAMAAAPMAGMRRYGGNVGYGSNYEVAEGGQTELYIPKSGNPMLMGSKGGQVVSNSDLMAAMGGGNQGVNVDVQIINQGSPVEVTGQQSGFNETTGRQFIKLWVSNFQSKGETYRAVTTGTNAKGRTD